MIRIVRLTRADLVLARELFLTMAAVFAEPCEPLDDDYLDRLLGRANFWAMAAFIGDDLAGGLTAHTLPMTTSPSSTIFIYDIAVRAEHQRQGVGRELIAVLRKAAIADGIRDVFVPADNDDTHALEFYRALGGAPTASTIFTFLDDEG